MTQKIIIILFVVLGIYSFSSAADIFDPSDEMTGQALNYAVDASDVYPQFQGKIYEDEQSLEFYSSGSLINADRLPWNGSGFVKILQPRNRRFGNMHTIELLTRVADKMTHLFPNGERLQIGDMAQEKGGPISHHASHQNGLDVDIVFYRMNHFEQDPQFEGGLTENFVRNGKVSANFDSVRNWQLIRELVGSGEVGRIFIDGAIKKMFCQKYYSDKSQHEALRTLRLWPNHTNHMHVRLNCPASSPRCRPQAPVPQEVGC